MFPPNEVFSTQPSLYIQDHHFDSPSDCSHDANLYGHKIAFVRDIMGGGPGLSSDDQNNDSAENNVGADCLSSLRPCEGCLLTAGSQANGRRQACRRVLSPCDLFTPNECEGGEGFPRRSASPIVGNSVNLPTSPLSARITDCPHSLLLH